MTPKYKNFKTIIALLAGFAVGVFALSAISPVSAGDLSSQVETGLNYATAAGLGTRDIREVIFLIINIILGFLGVVAVLLMIYAGFVWMTAGGEEKNIERAKKILINAVIGLVIIFASYAIAAFIVRQLVGVTGPEEKPCDAGDPPFDCSAGACLRERTCDVAKGVYGSCQIVNPFDPACAAFLPECTATSLVPPPPANPQVRNSTVVFKVNAPLDKTTIDVARFEVKCTAGGCAGSVIDGTFSYRSGGTMAVFTPIDNCPPPNATRKCFPADATFDVNILDGVGGVQCNVSGGKKEVTCITIGAGGPIDNCTQTFSTNNIVDVTDPTITLLNANICEAGGAIGPGNNILRATIGDNVGVRDVEYFIPPPPGVSIGTDMSPTIPNSEMPWSPVAGTAGTTIRVTAVATDVDSNTAQSQRDYLIRKSSCCNGALDGTEEGTDCGGPDCQSCTLVLPIIDYISPSDEKGTPSLNDDEPFGAQGNLISIWGRNFGAYDAANSAVYFDDGTGTFPIKARLADLVNPSCTLTWTDNQIIVEVPIGIADDSRVPIKVVTKDLLSDTTNDISAGERNILNFHVDNTQVLPGACQIINSQALSPDEGTSKGSFDESTDIEGINFGAGRDRVYFGQVLSVVPTSATVVWADTQIQNAKVPNLAPNDNVGVTVEVAGKRSNALRFEVLATGKRPVIYDFNPKKGEVGEYVTIVGANFGNVQGGGLVEFAGVVGDFTFPEICSDRYWSDSRIVVKAPVGAVDGVITVQTDSGDVATSLVAFDYDGLPVGPGICYLYQPEIQLVNIYGERFADVSSVTFYKDKVHDTPIGAIPAKGDDTGFYTTLVPGKETLVTRVPIGAETGPVFVTGAKDSNTLNFTVGKCTSNDQCSVGAGDECCLAGDNAGLCRPKGQCGGVPKESAFTWYFTTGNLGPHVIESCTRTNSCSLGGISSPSPLLVRDGGVAGVPVNSIISANFDQLMDETTLTGANIILHKCSDDKCLPAGLTPVAGAVTFNTWNYKGALNSAHYIRFTPVANLGKNSFYIMELKSGPTGIKSQLNQELVPNLRLTNSYAWVFKTKDSDLPGNVGCIDCSPKSSIIMSKYDGTCVAGDKDCQKLEGEAFDRDDFCVYLNQQGFNWKWESLDATQVGISDELDGGVATNKTTWATALAETPINDPAKVQASVTVAGAEVLKTTCDVQVSFSTPVVVDRWPDCGLTCANAAFGVEFSINMDNTTLVPANIKVYSCGADFNCNTTENMHNTGDVDALTIVDKTITFNINPGHYSRFLIPGVYYRVVLNNSIKSKDGKSLLLNFDDPNGGLGGNDSYSWVFKTRADLSLCVMTRVDVRPSNISLPGGVKQLYGAIPYGGPDSCRAQGQALSPYVVNEWAWELRDSAPVGVASLDRIAGSLRDACGNGVIETGENCDDGNLTLGDGCSNECVREPRKVGVADRVGTICGNGLIEDKEECDDGNTLNGDGCSGVKDISNKNRLCVLEGSISGRALCGDGILGPGESCESCGGAINPITKGTCAASDFATDNIVENGDECSDRCILEDATINTGSKFRAPYSICSNGVVEKDEECDDGDDDDTDICNNRCLISGSYYETKDPFNVGPFQFVNTLLQGSIKVFAEATIGGDNKEGYGELKVTSNATVGPPVGPLGPFRVIKRYPQGDNNCKNQYAVAVLSHPLDPTTLATGVTVTEDTVAYAPEDISSLGNEIKIKAKGGVWSVGKEYKVALATSILRAADGRNLLCDATSKCEWTFKVTDTLCKPTSVEVTPPFANVLPDLWSQALVSPAYSAQAYDAYKPPFINLADITIPEEHNDTGVNNNPNISGTLSCDTSARICIKSEGSGDFSISAMEDAEACGGAKVKTISALYVTSKLQKNVLLLGCGLALEFPSAESVFEKDDLWSIPILAGSPVAVTNLKYSWTKAELSGDQGDNAIKGDKVVATCPDYECRDFQAETWTPFTGYRQAKVIASVVSNPTARGQADFYVGNICEKKFGSGDLGDIYPVALGDDTIWTAHFDDSLDGFRSDGSKIVPTRIEKITFDNGLTDAKGGVLGKAVVIDDPNSVLVYPSLNNINPQIGSISFWVRPKDITGEQMLFNIHTGGQAEASGEDIRIFSTDGNVTFRYFDATNANGYTITDDIPLTIDEWHYIVVNYYTTLTEPGLYSILGIMYIDGREVTFLDLPFGTKSHLINPTVDYSIFLGSRYNITRRAHAIIDELEVRSELMSKEEIDARYLAYTASCLSDTSSSGPQIIACSPDFDTTNDQCDSGKVLVCTNPLISATFGEAMDEESILRKNPDNDYINFILCGKGKCDDPKNNLIDELSYDPVTHAVSVRKLKDISSLNTGLILKMDFDEDNFDDTSTANHDGTCAKDACPRWTSSGRFGGGYVFDGTNDFVSAGNVLKKDESLPFTMSAWVKTDIKNTEWKTIIGTDQSFAEVAVSSDADGNSAKFGQNSGATSWFVDGGVIPESEWHHIVGVYDGTNATIFVDGALKEGPVLHAFDENHGVTLLGKLGLASSQEDYFAGTLDEVRIWERALLAEEIKQMYVGSLLVPGQSYEIRVVGGLNGIKNIAGVPYKSGGAVDDFIWGFKIKDDAKLCNCERANILAIPFEPGVTGSLPAPISSDYFYCFGKDCPNRKPADVDSIPETAPLPSVSLGNDHRLEAQCVDLKDPQLPLDPARLTFKWSEIDPQGVISKIHTGDGTEDFTKQIQYVVNTSKIGTGAVRVAVEGTGDVGGHAEKEITTHNNVCSNPWPRDSIYKDSDNAKAPDTGWEFWYCRDRGQVTMTDDLPGITESPIVITAGAGALPKEIVFSATYHLANSPVAQKTGIQYNVVGSSSIVNMTDENAKCSFANADTASWTFDLIVPKDGQYQLSFDVFNYDASVSHANPSDFSDLFDVKVFVDGTEKVLSNFLYADEKEQRFYVDVGYLKADEHTIKIDLSGGNAGRAGLWEENMALCSIALAPSGKINDVIGLRVLPNPLHLSPNTWYQSGICAGTDAKEINNVCFSNADCSAGASCAFNVPNRANIGGSTSEVNGFPAVRSGRTVYVSAANEQAGTLYSNIYLISYNENANNETKTIFDRLLASWKFGGLLAESDIDKVRRDVIRFANIRDMQIELRNYFKKNAFYPLWDNTRKQFSGGTYIPGTTFSVWPSWSTLTKLIPSTGFDDPINEFVTCPNPCCAGGTCASGISCNANATTCWDEKALKFVCPSDLPITFAYGYNNLGATKKYNLSTNFEYTNGKWSDELTGNLSSLTAMLSSVCAGAASGDLDGDSVPDVNDNCPPSACVKVADCSNGAQTDTDGDFIGDACDFCESSATGDPDHDGICENKDNCPFVFNPDQRNSDAFTGDTDGDACSVGCQKDSDADGTCDELDNCPFVSNPGQENFDGGAGEYPPAVPRYCAKNSPDQDRVGNACLTDSHVVGCGEDPDNGAPFDFCLTPDEFAGQVWPNGRHFGDACDPNTDPDNDGFAAGFCGGYTDFDESKMKLCNNNDDCRCDIINCGDYKSRGVQNPDKCLKLLASNTSRMDNCSINSHVGTANTATGPIYASEDFTATFNPGQEDFDNDLVGYLCDECIDSDNDEFTDYIINESFESGLGQWKLWKEEGAADAQLTLSINYTHLDDTSWQNRSDEDTASRGTHAAHLRAQGAGAKRVMMRKILPGLTQLSQNSDAFKDVVAYTARARVKVGTPDSTITMRVLRGCTKDRFDAQIQLNIPYIASCKGPANEYGSATFSGSTEWTTLEIPFYVDFLSAQNEVAFIFEVGAGVDDNFYIDDVQIFFASNVGRDRGDSCGSAEKVDNCPVFSNPSICVGGVQNGKICATNIDCIAVAGGAVGKPASCKEILDAGASHGSDYYDIYPGRGDTAVKVYCDMDNGGGGWTLVARINDEGSNDLSKHWVAYKNSDMKNTWWFNGAPGGELLNAGGVYINRDYKNAAFDTLPFSDLMVTVHNDADTPDEVMYGLWANGIGDPTMSFANQTIWTSPVCALNTPGGATNNGVFGSEKGNEADVLPGLVVNRLILGAKDGNDFDDGLDPLINDEEPTGADVCVKKIDLSDQGILNDLVNKDPVMGVLHYKAGGVPDTESPEFSVIGFASDSAANNTGPLGVGNFGDGNNIGGATGDFYMPSKVPIPLFAQTNYALVWFRESSSAVLGSGDGVCMQPDFDEDNIGDACDQCTDRDGDTFGDRGYDFRGCKGSFSKSDNCPITVNVDQADYDNDSSECAMINPLPYLAVNSDPSCKDSSSFLPSKCNFCGGDACDLDADNDRCYNWEQVRKPFNHEFELPEWNEVSSKLLNREEGYLQSGRHDELTWLSFSTDTDNDGLPTDCDAQTCGNGVLENTAGGGNVCQDFSIGARQCEECDLSDFGVTSDCKKANPFGAGTVSDIYPFKLSSSDSLFIAHFDGSTLAQNQGGVVKPTQDLGNYTFTDGLSDGNKTLGKAIVITKNMAGDPTKDLVYPHFANGKEINGTAEGSINLWVKPINRDISQLKMHDPVTNAEFIVPVGWAQGTWHMITGIYDTVIDIGPFKFAGFRLFIDGEADDTGIIQLPLDQNVQVTQLLYFLGLQVDEPGQELEVALDEVMTFSKALDISEAGQIWALYSAVAKSCLDPSAESIGAYMIQNLCASCNSLQCQIKTLRTCLPLKGFDLDTSKIFTNPEFLKPENITQFLWVHSERLENDVHKFALIGTDAGKVVGTINGRRTSYLFDVNTLFGSVWLSDLNGAADAGVTQYGFDLSIQKQCNGGSSSDGSQWITIDNRGNSWGYIGSGQNNIRFEYSQANDPLCTNNTGGIRWITNVGVPDGGVRMIVDSDNHLWVMQPTYDRTIRINLNRIYTGDTIAPGDYVFAISGSTCSINGDSSACRYYNTVDPRDMALDALGTAWISHGAGIYKVVKSAQDSSEMENLPFVGILFSPSRVTIDINNNLWVENRSKVGGGVDNLLIQIDTEIDKETGITADPPGSAPIYGLASDTLGNIWAKHNGTEISRFKASDGTSNGLFPVAGTSMITSGLSPRILSVYEKGRTFEIPFDLEAVSTANGKWLNRWGKILYDVDPTGAIDKIIARVSLSEDDASLGNNWIEIKEFNNRIGKEPPISMDEYMAMSDADKDTNKNRELTGKYLKIRFEVDANEGEVIKVNNLRITCKDSAGRNICL